MTTAEITTPLRGLESDQRPASRLDFYLFRPISIAPIIFFRLVFGLLMTFEVAHTLYTVLRPDWIEPKLNFTYYGFGWVAAPRGMGMPIFLSVTLAGAIGVTLGLFYRVSAAVLAIGFTWYFLIDQSNYLNHFYLVCILGFVAIFLPADRALSLDARRNPALRSDMAPAWTLHLLQMLMAIVYIFGAIAKINYDWLRGEPVRTWLYAGRLADRLPDALQNEFVVYMISYGGLFFDLLIVPLILWRRTRALALAVAIFFHLSNSYLFNIGIFPYLSIAMTLLLMPGRWLEKLLRIGTAEGAEQPYWVPNRIIPTVLAVGIIVQLFLPFRHWLYAGNVHWTEEGHRFAWHMMLRTKQGEAYYIVEDRRSAKLWRIHPRGHLTQRQYSKMTTHPEMILQFAHYIRDRWSHPDIAIHAITQVTFNGRPVNLLIDPEVDLARIEYGLRAASWVLPPENLRPTPGRFRFAQSAPGFPGI